MLSILLHFNFAFNFNLRRYTLAKQAENPVRKKFDRHAPRVRRCKLTRRNQLSPVLKAPGTKRLKVKYDDLLSVLLHFCFNFAFNFSLRLSIKKERATESLVGRCRLTLSEPVLKPPMA